MTGESKEGADVRDGDKDVVHPQLLVITRSAAGIYVIEHSRHSR